MFNCIDPTLAFSPVFSQPPSENPDRKDPSQLAPDEDIEFPIATNSAEASSDEDTPCGNTSVSPGPEMLQFLHSQLKTYGELLLMSYQTGRHQAAVLESMQQKPERDHVLLSLTIVTNFVASRNADVLQFMDTHSTLFSLVSQLALLPCFTVHVTYSGTSELRAHTGL